MIDSFFSRETWQVWLLVTCVVGTQAACGLKDDEISPLLPLSQFPASIQLEHHAYNLATSPPYNTVQLRAFVYSGAGVRMELPVTYTVKDSNVLTVTNDGRLQAQSTTTGTIVRVSATLNGVIRTDSAWVNISDGALRPRVSQVSLQVPQGDSAKWAKSYDLGDKKLQLVRQDSSGANISALRVAVWSSDSTKATVAQSGNDVSVHVTQPGEVTFYVESYAYGSTFRDSLRFIVGWPVNEAITGYKRFRTGEANPIVDFAPGRIIVGAGACIQWYNISAMPVDVEFSDPSKAEEPTGLVCRLFSMRDTNGGNIASFQETYNPNGTRNDFSIRRGRTFNVPGIYTYRSKLYGTTGIIVVCGASNKTLPDCANNN